MAAERNFHGIHFMLPTPFDQNGDVDTTSFARLVAGARTAKCTGDYTFLKPDMNSPL